MEPPAAAGLSAAWHRLSTALVPPAALGLVSGGRPGKGRGLGEPQPPSVWGRGSCGA